MSWFANLKISTKFNIILSLLLVFVFLAAAFFVYHRERALIDRIAVGGMAEIFLARARLGGIARTCVIKRILPEYSTSRPFVSMFIDEARITIGLEHEHIVKLFHDLRAHLQDALLHFDHQLRHQAVECTADTGRHDEFARQSCRLSAWLRQFRLCGLRRVLGRHRLGDGCRGQESGAEACEKDFTDHHEFNSIAMSKQP